jgi:hypothetical protein
MSRQFQAALAKLIDDGQYRRQVANDPQRIVSDFELSGADLRMLMSIGRPEGLARARTLAGGCSCSCPRVKS